MPVATPITEDFTPTLLPSPGKVAPVTVAQGSLATPAAAQATGTTTSAELAGILNKGGPLMQQAATMGNQQAASRGLLNSSMGVQAAQAATYAAATPIANADASAKNQIELSNTGAANQFAQQNASTINQNLQTTANTENQANQFNTSVANDFAKTNTNTQNVANQWSAGQQNAATLQAMDANNRESLANIEAAFKTKLQINSTAGALHEQVMKNIADIQNNKDVADKQTAINSQLAQLRSSLQMVQSLNSISGLVTF